VLPPPAAASVHFELAIASGTGRFAGMTGTIVLDVVLFATPHPQPPGTASGTVFAPPAPTAKRECMDGGWRTLVDDAARPFKNQGPLHRLRTTPRIDRVPARVARAQRG
jgi:hypothetical protein